MLEAPGRLPLVQGSLPHSPYCATEIPFPVSHNMKWKHGDYTYVVQAASLSIHGTSFGPSWYVPRKKSEEHAQLFAHVGVKASRCQQLRQFGGLHSELLV